MMSLLSELLSGVEIVRLVEIVPVVSFGFSVRAYLQWLNPRTGYSENRHSQQLYCLLVDVE
jgi:hypothetical protein